MFMDPYPYEDKEVPFKWDRNQIIRFIRRRVLKGGNVRTQLNYKTASEREDIDLGDYIGVFTLLNNNIYEIGKVIDISRKKNGSIRHYRIELVWARHGFYPGVCENVCPALAMSGIYTGNKGIEEEDTTIEHINKKQRLD